MWNIVTLSETEEIRDLIRYGGSAATATLSQTHFRWRQQMRCRTAFCFPARSMLFYFGKVLRLAWVQPFIALPFSWLFLFSKSSPKPWAYKEITEKSLNLCLLDCQYVIIFLCSCDSQNEIILVICLNLNLFWLNINMFWFEVEIIYWSFLRWMLFLL